MGKLIRTTFRLEIAVLCKVLNANTAESGLGEGIMKRFREKILGWIFSRAFKRTRMQFLRVSLAILCS